MEKDHARPPPRPWAEWAPFIRRPSTQGDVPMATSWGHSPALHPCRIGPSRPWPRARPAGCPAHAQQRPSSVARAVLGIPRAHCQGRPRSAAPCVGAGVLPRSRWDPTGSPLSGWWLFHRRSVPCPPGVCCLCSTPAQAGTTLLWSSTREGHSGRTGQLGRARRRFPEVSAVGCCPPHTPSHPAPKAPGLPLPLTTPQLWKLHPTRKGTLVRSDTAGFQIPPNLPTSPRL